jgi:hypothetical protein
VIISDGETWVSILFLEKPPPEITKQKINTKMEKISGPKILSFFPETFTWKAQKDSHGYIIAGQDE